ncbi:hypothetical protein [Flavobacterium beibuense]|uniref:hypothetical protein n=1 Tax=Flavobacterium beibuense TaxID=657326 RepID=UPI003A9562A0
MIKTKSGYIVFAIAIVFVLLSFGLQQSDTRDTKIALSNPQQEYVAGSAIALSFTGTEGFNKAVMMVKSSYGSTVLQAKGNEFLLPDFMAAKTGQVHWYLFFDDELKLQGNFTIVPNAVTTGIETYLGPRTVNAGNENYTMMVTIPHDAFDNPVADSTAITLKHQFRESINEEALYTENFIAFERITAPQKTGKMLLSSNCGTVATREFEADVYAALPVNFTINFTRNHEYADGNQLTTVYTSELKDKYGNTVNDGTSVTFMITTGGGNLLKTYGNTINGIAQSKIPSPEREDSYTIKAYITGIAESNEITVSYKSALKGEIKYTFSKDKRTITVGPLQSFMKQLVPNGTTVSLKLYNKSGQEVSTIQEYTINGKAVFSLSKGEYKGKAYSFEISVMGHTQKTGLIQYESE